MWSPQCLLLLFQALVPGLAGCIERQHGHAQEDPVFLDDSTALRFLGRKPLSNHWDFELIVPDNLERECKEEVCNYEEAREVFEDDILTAEKSHEEKSYCTEEEKLSVRKAVHVQAFSVHRKQFK